MNIMKKDLHNLIYTIWIDGKTAMIMRDEPHGTHHFEVIHNEHAGRERFWGETTDKTGMLGRVEDRQVHKQNRENQEHHDWAKEIAKKVSYANKVHILGPGEIRHLLQHEIEGNKQLINVMITNAPCDKLSEREFLSMARENAVS